jgi:hypothetical protein
MKNLIFVLCIILISCNNRTPQERKNVNNYCKNCDSVMQSFFTNWCAEVKYVEYMSINCFLDKGESLQSKNEKVKLTFGTDGSLVVVCCDNMRKEKNATPQGHIWHLSSNNGENQKMFRISNQGNIQIINEANKVTFQVNECLNCPTCKLYLMDDGNLVFKDNDKIYWQSNATCRDPKDGISGYGVPFNWQN